MRAHHTAWYWMRVDVYEYKSEDLCELADVAPKMSDAMRAELLGALQSVHTQIVQWDKCT